MGLDFAHQLERRHDSDRLTHRAVVVIVMMRLSWLVRRASVLCGLRRVRIAAAVMRMVTMSVETAILCISVNRDRFGQSRAAHRAVGCMAMLKGMDERSGHSDPEVRRKNGKPDRMTAKQTGNLHNSARLTKFTTRCDEGNKSGAMPDCNPAVQCHEPTERTHEPRQSPVRSLADPPDSAPA